MQAKIKFIDEVPGKFGPQFKIKAAPVAGGDDVTCYISQDSPLAKDLAKGVIIELDTTAGKFPKITGIAPAEPTQQSQSNTTGPDFATICATWAAAYEFINKNIPAASDEAKLSVTSTVFIQAASEKAWIR